MLTHPFSPPHQSPLDEVSLAGSTYAPAASTSTNKQVQPSLLRALQTGFQIYAALPLEARREIHERRRKPSSLRRLAHTKGVPASTLWRALAAYLLYLRHPEIASYEHLGVSHLSVILGLPEDAQLHFLRNVEGGRWSRRQLNRRVRRFREGSATQEPYARAPTQGNGLPLGR
jgi:hypothetical protein